MENKVAFGLLVTAIFLVSSIPIIALLCILGSFLVWMGIIPVGSKSYKESSRSPKGDFKGQLNKLNLGNKLAIGNLALSDVLDTNVIRYYKSFKPNSSILEKFVIGQIAGGSIGNTYSMYTFVSGIQQMNQDISITTPALLFNYKIESIDQLDENSQYIIYCVCALYTYKLISPSEYIRSMVSLFYYYGEPNLMKDALGVYKFESDESKYGAAVGMQYLIENVIPLENIINMVDEKTSLFPNKDVLDNINAEIKNSGIFANKKNESASYASTSSEEAYTEDDRITVDRMYLKEEHLGIQIAKDFLDNRLNLGEVVKYSTLKLRDTYSVTVENGFVMQMVKYINSGEVLRIEVNNDDFVFLHKDYAEPLNKGNDGPLSKALAVIWDDNIRYYVEVENEFDTRKGWIYWKEIRPDSYLSNLNVEKETKVNWVKAGWHYIAASADEDSPWYSLIQYCKSKGLVIVFRFNNKTINGYEEGKNDPNSYYNSPCWVWGLKTPAEALDHHSEPFFYQDNLEGKVDRTIEGAFNTVNTPDDHPLSPILLEVTDENVREIILEWKENYSSLYLI